MLQLFKQYFFESSKNVPDYYNNSKGWPALCLRRLRALERRQEQTRCCDVPWSSLFFTGFGFAAAALTIAVLLAGRYRRTLTMICAPARLVLAIFPKTQVTTPPTRRKASTGQPSPRLILKRSRCANRVGFKQIGAAILIIATPSLCLPGKPTVTPARYLTVNTAEVACTAFARSVVTTVTTHFSPALAPVGRVSSTRR